MALTKLQCDHAVCPPGKVRLRLADEHGLYLEVTAAGSKYWRMKYRFADKEKRIAFGVYPEVTLAEARQRVEKPAASCRTARIRWSCGATGNRSWSPRWRTPSRWSPAHGSSTGAAPGPSAMPGT